MTDIPALLLGRNQRPFWSIQEKKNIGNINRFFRLRSITEETKGEGKETNRRLAVEKKTTVLRVTWTNLKQGRGIDASLYRRVAAAEALYIVLLGNEEVEKSSRARM